MKLLKDISIENYNDVQYCFDYLNRNWTVPTNAPHIKGTNNFHCFWQGQLNNRHLMSLKSLIGTQSVEFVTIWTDNIKEIWKSPVFPQVKFSNRIKVLEFNRDIVDMMSNVTDATKDKLWNLYSKLIKTPLNTFNTYNHDAAYASDIFRFIVLNVYGGIYFDMDILFLRNFNEIGLDRWMTQWGTDECGNACVMKLEQGHDLVEKIVKDYPTKPFYPTLSFKFDNDLDITVLPSAFFDPLWRPSQDIPENVPFKHFDDFFGKDKEWYIPEFFKGTFAYHWHNHWNWPTPKIIIDK